MKIEDIKRILIMGAGTMGQQIAAVCAINNYTVIVYDTDDKVFEKSMERINRILMDFVKSKKIAIETADNAKKRITMTTNLKEAAKDVDLVSESIPEDPALKGKVFAQLNELCPGHTIFTTNTSTLLPSMFAGATGRPEKVVALHFHNVRTTNIVDVMPHPNTSPEVVELVTEFAHRIGQIPIVLKKESNGYVFNAMISALFKSAHTLAANEVASVEDIDRAWMGVTGMTMGPFGIMDTIGLETVWKVTEFWAKTSKGPQALKNAAFLKQYVDKGTLGTKTGKGFYSYPGPEYSKPDFVSGLKKK